MVTNILRRKNISTNLNTYTWSLSDDGSIRRSATLAGRHLVKSITFPASDLKLGENTVTFTASNCKDKSGVLYDCIKLEAGNKVSAGADYVIDSDSSMPVSVYTLTGLHVGEFESYPTDLPAGIYIIKQGKNVKKVRF